MAYPVRPPQPPRRPTQTRSLYNAETEVHCGGNRVAWANLAINERVPFTYCLPGESELVYGGSPVESLGWPVLVWCDHCAVDAIACRDLLWHLDVLHSLLWSVGQAGGGMVGGAGNRAFHAESVASFWTSSETVILLLERAGNAGIPGRGMGKASKGLGTLKASACR